MVRAHQTAPGIVPEVLSFSRFVVFQSPGGSPRSSVDLSHFGVSFRHHERSVGPTKQLQSWREMHRNDRILRPLGCIDRITGLWRYIESEIPMDLLNHGRRD